MDDLLTFVASVGFVGLIIGFYAYFLMTDRASTQVKQTKFSQQWRDTARVLDDGWQAVRGSVTGEYRGRPIAAKAVDIPPVGNIAGEEQLTVVLYGRPRGCAWSLRHGYGWRLWLGRRWVVRAGPRCRSLAPDLAAAIEVMREPNRGSASPRSATGRSRASCGSAGGPGGFPALSASRTSWISLSSWTGSTSRSGSPPMPDGSPGAGPVAPRPAPAQVGSVRNSWA